MKTFGLCAIAVALVSCGSHSNHTSSNLSSQSVGEEQFQKLPGTYELIGCTIDGETKSFESEFYKKMSKRRIIEFVSEVEVLEVRLPNQNGKPVYPVVFNFAYPEGGSSRTLSTDHVGCSVHTVKVRQSGNQLISRSTIKSYLKPLCQIAPLRIQRSKVTLKFLSAGEIEINAKRGGKDKSCIYKQITSADN